MIPCYYHKDIEAEGLRYFDNKYLCHECMNERDFDQKGFMDDKRIKREVVVLVSTPPNSNPESTFNKLINEKKTCRLCSEQVVRLKHHLKKSHPRLKLARITSQMLERYFK